MGLDNGRPDDLARALGATVTPTRFTDIDDPVPVLRHGPLQWQLHPGSPLGAEVGNLTAVLDHPGATAEFDQYCATLGLLLDRPYGTMRDHVGVTRVWEVAPGRLLRLSCVRRLMFQLVHTAHDAGAGAKGRMPTLDGLIDRAATFMLAALDSDWHLYEDRRAAFQQSYGCVELGVTPAGWVELVVLDQIGEVSLLPGFANEDGEHVASQLGVAIVQPGDWPDANLQAARDRLVDRLADRLGPGDANRSRLAKTVQWCHGARLVQVRFRDDALSLLWIEHGPLRLLEPQGPSGSPPSTAGGSYPR